MTEIKVDAVQVMNEVFGQAQKELQDAEYALANQKKMDPEQREQYQYEAETLGAIREHLNHAITLMILLNKSREKNQQSSAAGDKLEF